MFTAGAIEIRTFLPIVRAPLSRPFVVFRITALFLVAFFFAGKNLQAAATITWIGNTNTAWATPTNWDLNRAPTSSDDVVLTGAGANRPINQNIAGLSINSLKFDATCLTSINIAGSPLTLTSATVNELTLDASAVNQTISCNIVLAGTQPWNIGTSRTLTVAGVLSGGGVLTVNGSGTLLLSSPNTYTGTTNVNNGTLLFGISAAIRNGNDVVVHDPALLNIAAFNCSFNTLTMTGGTVSGTGTMTLTSGAQTPSPLTSKAWNTTAFITANVNVSVLPAVANTGLFFTVESGTVPTGIDLEIDGVISGSNNNWFRKTGPGFLGLTGANQTIPDLLGGTLGIGNSMALGATNGDLAVWDATDSTQLNPTYSNAPNALVAFNGVFTIATPIQFEDVTTLTFNVDGAGDVTVTGLINQLNAGAVGSILKTGNKALTLSNGANAYTGTTTVSAGTLIAGANSPSGANGAFGNAVSSIVLGDANTTLNNSSPAVLTGGGFTIGRPITIANQATTGTYTIGGNTANNSSFSAAITANQPFTISQVGASTLTLSGGVTSGNAGTKTISIIGPGATTFNTTAISNGSGAIAVASSAGTTTYSFANLYSGGTTITGGSLVLGALNGVPSMSAVAVLSPGVFNLNGNSDSIGSLAGSGAVTLGAGTLTLGNDSTNATYSGAISGAGALTKTGTGVQTFSGTNSYAGLTTISGGTLRLQGDTGTLLSAGTGTSGIAIGSGATFDIDGSGLATAAPDRIPNAAPITFNGGTFSMTASAAGAGNRTETVGKMTFNSLDNFIILTPAGGNSVVLNGTTTFGQAGTATLTYVRNSGGGSGLAHLTSSTQGVGAVAFATVVGGSPAVSNPATYDIANASDGLLNGLTAAAPTVFTSQQNGDWNTATTWLSGSVPTAGSQVNIKHAVTIGSPVNAPFSVTFAAGAVSSLTASAAGQSITVGAGGIVVNTGVNGVLGGGANPLTLNSGTATLAINTQGTSSLAINNIISNTTTPRLTKTGSGTLTLAGANTFAGPATISQGTLIAANTAALGPGATSVLIGATLALQLPATGTIANSMNIQGNGLAGIGGIENISGFNTTLSGAITLAGASTIANAAAGTLILSGGTVPTSGNALTFGGSGNITVGDVISAGGSVTMAGTGVLTLSGANSYTGDTIVSSGTLKLGASNVIPDGANFGNVTVNGTLDMSTFSETINGLSGAGTIDDVSGGATPTLTIGNNNSTSAFTGAIKNTTGTLALTKTGSGTLTLSGNNTYGGTTNLSAGTLNINSATALGTGLLTISGASTIDNTSAGSITLSNNNAQNWNADFTFTGTQNLNLGTGAVTLSGTRTVTTSANTLTEGGTVSGVAFGLTKQGPGILTLTGSNTYSGATTINAGTLSVNTLANGGSPSNIGQSTVAAGNLVLGGGTLQYTGASVTINRGFSLTNGTVDTIEIASAASNLTISGIGAATSGALTKIGAGTLTLANTNGYTGGTTVNAGTFAYGADNVLADAAPVTVSGGTFDINSHVDTVGAVTLGSGSITGTTGVLTGASYAVQSGTISAILAGAAQLTKTTNGTVTLSGVNTFTGATNVNAGTLLVNGADASSAVSLNGGTLGGGIGTIAGTIAGITSTALGGTLDPGTSATTAILKCGALNFATAAPAYQVELNGNVTPGTDYDQLQVTGTATLTGATLRVILLPGFVGAVGNTYTIMTTTTGFGATTFSGLAEGTTLVASGHSFTISYLANAGKNVTLTQLPSTLIWTGAGGASNNFSNTNNWGGFTSPASGDDLVFPAVANESPNNDSVAGTSYDSIQFQASGYTLSGNSIALGAAGLSDTTSTTLGINTVSLPLSLAASETFNIVTAGETITATAGISGAGGITKSGSGTLVLGGPNSYLGTTTVSAGTLQVGNTATAGTLGTGIVTNNAALVFNRSDTVSISNLIGGAGSLAQAGAGTTALTGANTYTGKTSIQNGTLSVSSLNKVAGGAASSNLGAPVTVSNGTIDLGSTTTAGVLLYTGTGETTDRVVNLAGTTGGGTLNQSGTGTLGFSSAFTATGTGSKMLTLQGSTAGAGSVSNVITDNSAANKTSVVKSGTGAWTLAAANTYTGATTISAGTLIAGANAPSGAAGAFGNSAAAVILGDAGTTANNSSPTLLTGGAFTVARALTVANQATSGTYTIGGNTNNNSTFSGAIGISQPLNISQVATTGANTLSITGGVSAAVVNTVTFIGPGASNVGNTALANGAAALSLTVNGGTTTLSVACTYSGNTTIAAGTLKLGAADVIPDGGGKGNVIVTGTLDLNSFNDTINGLSGTGNVDNSVSGNPILTVGNADVTSAFSGVIKNTAGSLTLSKTGTGTLTLSGVNTYRGATNFNGGIVQISASANLGDASATNTIGFNGGTLESTANTYNLTSNRVITLNGAGTLQTDGGVLTIDGAVNNGSNLLTVQGVANTTISGVIGNGSGGVTKAGTGTLTLSGSNTFTGATTINTGTLSVAALANGGSASGIGQSTNSAANLILGGGTLQYTGGTVSTDRAFTLTNATISTFAVATAATNLTFSGNSAATTGALTKNGPGTLILSGTNPFSGATTISAGTLLVNGSDSNSAVSINGGALGGSGLVGNVASTGAGGTVDPATTATTGILKTGNLDLSAGAARVFQIELNGSATPGTNYDQLQVAGTATLTNATLSANLLPGFSGAVGNTYTVMTASGGFGGTTFSGLAEGATLSASGHNFTISYVGNTVTLTQTRTTVTWTGGGGASTLFSNAANWGGVTTPAVGDDLVFPAVANESPTNDSAAGTSYNSIQFQASGYALSGNSIAVGAGNLTDSTVAGVGTNTVSLPLTLAAATTFGVATGGETVVLSGAVSGAGAVTKTGAGTLTLSALNSYTGVTTINGGTLSATTLANGGSSSSIGASGNAAANLVLNGGTLQYTGPAANTDRLFSIGIGGATVDASGAGLLSFTNSGTLGFNAQAGARSLTLTGSGAGSLSPVIGDSGGATSVIKSSAGTWTFGGTGANTYSGSTSINSGELDLSKPAGTDAVPAALNVGDGIGAAESGIVRLINANQIDNASAVTINSDGLLDLNNQNETVAAFSGSGALQFGSGTANTFTVGDSTNTAFSGTFSGTSDATDTLAKQGSGTLTLSGPSSYTGTVAVNTGTLLVDGSLSNAATSTVANGATLGGTGAVKVIAVQSGGIIAPGDPGINAGVGKLTASTATFSTGAVLLIQAPGTTAGTFDQLALTGSLTDSTGAVLRLTGALPTSGTASGLVTYASHTGQFVLDNPSTTSGAVAAYNVNSLDLSFSLPFISIEWATGTNDSNGTGIANTGSPAIWTLNGISLGAVRTTDPTGSDPTLDFIVQNNGSVNETFAVTCAPTTIPAGWSLNGAAGKDKFEAGVNNDGSNIYTQLSLGAFALTPAKISIGSTQNFDLRFKAPTTTSSAATKQVKITVTATAP